MRKIVAGLSMSLDGVVARPNAWMRFDAEMGALVSAGVARADAVLLGTATYRDFAGIWPAQSDDVPMAAFLNQAPKYVVSSSLTDADLGWHNSTLLAGDLAAEVSRLKALPGRDILVPGSPRLVRSLLGLGLLDQLELMIHPVVVGTGLRLFDGLADVRLRLLETRHLRAGGAVALSYAGTEAAG